MNVKEFWNKVVGDNRDSKETEFLPAILEVTETPPSPVGRLVMWTMIVLLLVGCLWSIFSKIDEVAIANGKIIPVGQVKIVQAEDKGIIKELYVKEGEYVKAGQILVELDTTRTGADLDQLKKQVAYYQLTLDRLNAEISDAPFQPQKAENVEPKDLIAQQALYSSRRGQLQSQLARVDMEVEQSESEVQSALAIRDKLSGQVGIAIEMEDRLKTLQENGAVSLFQLLQQQSTRVEYQQNLRSQEKLVLKAQSALSEASERKQNVLADYKKEVMTDMVEARKQYNAYLEELKKAEQANRLATIVAPVDGRVNQLSVHTVGGVVTAAQALMMIVPDDAVLEVEAWADNKDIGFIQEGQNAEIKVETFNFQKFGIVEGNVREISPDAINDPSDKERHSKYRLSLALDTKDIIVEDNKVALSPGMRVTAEIKIKKKRVIDFFLDPFRQYQSEALRER